MAKLSWLDKFAEDQASKMEKTAALNKKAEQFIVDPEEVPDAVNGSEVTYKGSKYKVVDANYADELGNGIILEACDEALEAEASLEDEGIVEEAVEEVIDNIPVEETIQPLADPIVEKSVTDAPEVAHVDPGNVYHVEVRDTVEVDKFENEARETEKQIAEENAIDATTPEGRVNRILNRIKSPGFMAEAPVEEVVTVEEVEEPAVEEPIEEPVEELVEEPESSEDELKVEFASNRIFKKILSSIKK